MSTSSAISSLQQALNCAGKCDCCDKLQQQINTINARISSIKSIDENALKLSIKSSLEPGITSAIAGAAAVAVSKLAPQIDNLKQGLANTKSALNDANLAQDLKAANLQNKFNADLQAAIRRQAELDTIALQNASRNAIDQVARNTASTAIGNAAKASSEAANAANQVGGLRGLINGIGSRVNALGEAIGKVEGAVATAITNSAKAIGISEQALGKIAGFAGKILQLFNLVATIFTLLEQFAVLNTLGDRIDAVEAESQAIGNSVSQVLGKLLGLQNRIGRDEATINEVKGIAIDAKDIGTRASKLGESALLAAGKATIKANQAQLTADGAVRNAAIANSNATIAYTKANNAENIGTQAKNFAGQAFDKAGQAIGLGLTAIGLYQTVKSLRGLPGLPGAKGDKGDQGIPGRDGVTTVVTLPGTPGAPGKDGRPGINGFPGRDGKDGIDVNPADIAEIKALIVQQHTQTRGTVTGILAPIIAGINNSAGFTQRLITQVAQNTYVEKALSVLTFAATVHNGIMLSSNLGMTLETIINQVLGLVLPKGFDGTPLNVGEIINKSVEELLTEAVGESNYKTISQDWALANRIYAATSNVFNSLTNFTNMIVMGLEVIGGTCAQVGNALKKWGVVGDTAYQFFNPQPNFHNKAFQFLETANADANTILNVVQVPIMVNAAQEHLNQSVIDLNKAIGQAEGAKPGIQPAEAILEKAKADIEKNSSPAIFSVTTDFLQSVDWISNDDGGGE